MKRILAMILCLVLVLTSFTLFSCKDNEGGDDTSKESDNSSESKNSNESKTPKNPTCEEILNAVAAAYPDIPKQKSLYIAGAGEDDDHYIDPEYACYLYTGNYEELPDFSYFSDYAIRLPDGKSAFELHIVKAASESNVETVKNVLKQRIDRLNEGDIKLYDAEGFEKVIKNAEVYSDGAYVFLLITTGNEPAKTAINGALYS